MSKGKFIAIEGIDRSGKTTITTHLADELSKMNIDVETTREPWHPLLTNVIQESIKEKVDGQVEALLFAADRLLHLRSVIIPSINKGKWVISDRYVYSSIAYQTARGADFEWVVEVNKFALKPDLTILLDLSPEEAFRRIRLNDRLAQLEDRRFINEVRKIYLKLANEHGFLVIDGSLPVPQIIDIIISELKKREWI